MLNFRHVSSSASQIQGKETRDSSAFKPVTIADRQHTKRLRFPTQPLRYAQFCTFSSAGARMWNFSFGLLLFFLALKPSGKKRISTSRILLKHFSREVGRVPKRRHPSCHGNAEDDFIAYIAPGDASRSEVRRDAADARDGVGARWRPARHGLRLLRHDGRDRRVHGLHGRRRKSVGPLL